MRVLGAASKFVIAITACLQFIVVVQSASAYDAGHFPGKGNMADFKRGGACNQQACALANQGKDREAIEMFKKAISIYPYSACDYYDCGLSYSNLNDHKNAIKCFKQATDLAPDLEAAFFAMGNDYYALKDYSGAEFAWKKSIELDANDISPKINISEMYLEINKPADARKYLIQAKTLPKSRELHYANEIEEDLAKADKMLHGSTLKAKE